MRRPGGRSCRRSAGVVLLIAVTGVPASGVETGAGPVPAGPAAPLAATADLMFGTTVADLFPEPGMATAVASFPCRNTGSGTVRVMRVDYGCACTGWSVLVDGKPAERIPAGAEATFQLAVSVVGGSQGRQWKSATFICAGTGGQEEHHTLRFSYDTGDAIQLTRKCLYWDIGEAASPKATTFAVRDDVDPIRIIDVTPKTADFSVAVRTIAAGRRYEITATPRDAAASHIGSARVVTDSPYEAWRSFTVFLLVTQVQH